MLAEPAAAALRLFEVDGLVRRFEHQRIVDTNLYIDLLRARGIRRHQVAGDRIERVNLDAPRPHLVGVGEVHSEALLIRTGFQSFDLDDTPILRRGPILTKRARVEEDVLVCFDPSL